MNWLDWVLILSIVAHALDGYHRGLVKVLMRLIGVGAALVGAILWAGRLADYCDRRLALGERLFAWLSERLSVVVTMPYEAPAAVPTGETFSRMIQQFVTATVERAAVAHLIPEIIGLLTTMCAFVIAFVSIRLGMRLIESLICALAGPLLVRPWNKLLGACAAAAQSAVVICLGVGAMYAASVLPPLSFIAPWIDDSKLSSLALRALDLLWPYIYQLPRTH